MINEPVAIRYDFDGYGYQYMDSGSGSDWQTRVDGELLYADHPACKHGVDDGACKECYQEATHPVNPYQSITNTKIDPTVVSYTHPVKELDEDFDAICLENKRLQAEIEALKNMLEEEGIGVSQKYLDERIAELRKASEK